MRPPDSAPFRFAVVILAAGASSRMGRPKMLLPWNGTTVLGHLVSQWQKTDASQIAVVCAANDKGINQELDRIGFAREQRIINPGASRGMFSSIQAAARWPGWNAALTHWAIALGDQPHLANATLRAAGDFAAQQFDKICQPSWNGRPRHPVFLPRRVFETLAASTHQTLKEFLSEHASEARLIEVNDPGLDLDLDTPADFEEARTRFIT
ncbi:MAG TPA: nucleotidyltransferase family protein [Verrucomicrobiae bacterium]|jgi:molybdenum cofactor cytidylyltransferase